MTISTIKKILFVSLVSNALLLGIALGPLFLTRTPMPPFPPFVLLKAMSGMSKEGQGLLKDGLKNHLQEIRAHTKTMEETRLELLATIRTEPFDQNRFEKIRTKIESTHQIIGDMTGKKIQSLLSQLSYNDRIALATELEKIPFGPPELPDNP